MDLVSIKTPSIRVTGAGETLEFLDRFLHVVNDPLALPEW
jgi:hypothetical protein